METINCLYCDEELEVANRWNVKKCSECGYMNEKGVKTLPDYHPERDEIKRLRYCADGVGKKTARKILEKTRGIDMLQEANRSKVKSVSGVGGKTCEKLGIWDDDGNPVNDLPDNPCPICHEHAEREEEYDQGPHHSSQFDRFCLKTGGNPSDWVLYFHE